MDMSRLIKIDDKKTMDIPKLEEIARTEMHYFDAEGNACEKDQAVRFIATAYDREGNRINESWGTCTARETGGEEPPLA